MEEIALQPLTSCSTHRAGKVGEKQRNLGEIRMTKIRRTREIMNTTKVVFWATQYGIKT